jgi:2'-5' RNA ligase
VVRLFVGLSLPDHIKKNLRAVMSGVPGARWQTNNQLHLTLLFIGSVPEKMIADIDGALAAIRFDPFELALDSTGLFGTTRRPRLLWSGLSPSEPLRVLQQKISHTAIRLGLDAETRKYVAHITLARFSGRAVRLDRFLQANANLKSEPWPVDQFTLFRSHLGHGGAQYAVLSGYSANHPAATS